MPIASKQAAKSVMIERVISDVIRLHRRGTSIDESIVESRNAHLMPELGVRLQEWRRIERARQYADRMVTGSSDLDGPGAIKVEELPNELLEQYAVLKQLRHGGQGVVYKAIQRSTNRIVALKVLLNGSLATRRQRRRFEREADVVGRLRHPHIVTMFDCGEVSEMPYIVMEFIDGQSVDDYALINCPSARTTIELFQKICLAVHTAHQYGVIHRDLKPSNVLVDSDGDPHVLDFGLAMDLLPEDDSRVDRLDSIPGQIVGTLPYLSPEQVSGAVVEVDIRSDIYALGVMLYELLTETFPYPVFVDRGAVIQHIKSSAPVSPRIALTESSFGTRLQPAEIDADLEAVILKALEKEPALRYQSASQLADDLGRWLHNEVVEARADRRFHLLRKSYRRYRVQVIIAAAFLFLLVSALTAVTMLWQRAERDARTYKSGLEMGMLTRLGSVERDSGRVKQAVELMEHAIAIGQGIDAPPADIERFQYVALHELAELYYRRGKADLAAPYCLQAIDLAEQLAKNNPDDVWPRRYLALSHTLRAKMAVAESNWTEAAISYERAVDAYRNLIAFDSEDSRLQYELAVILGELGNCLSHSGSSAKLMECHDEALTTCQALVKAHPGVADYTICLARTEARIAVWHLKQKTEGDNQEAWTLLGDAHSRLDTMLRMGDVGDRVIDINVLLGQIEYNQKLASRRLGKLAEPN